MAILTHRAAARLHGRSSLHPSSLHQGTTDSGNSVQHDQSAIVVGGGVIGCSSAYFLAQRGWKVRLLEARRVGAGCSHGNCGFICPSHVLPLAMPGAVSSVLGDLFRRDAPISIKLRFDPALWSWLMRFVFRCRQEAMMRAAAARHALLASSIELYRELLAGESLTVEWQERGLLLVFKSPHELQQYDKRAELVQETFGIAAMRYDGAALERLEPALRPGLAGGWYFPDDAHLRPDKLLATLAGQLRARNVEILEGVTVDRVGEEQRGARTISTSLGSMTCDLVVLACGAESLQLARQLGCRLPIQPGKGYSITYPRPARPPSLPIIFYDYHVAVTPWPSGLRIGSTMEFAGYDRTMNRRRLELFQRAAAEYLVELPDGPVEEEWYGWRAMTYDDLPCIGQVPGAQRVLVATGHGMIGMATAPATGKLIAEIASAAPPHLDPTPYSLERFGR